MDGIDLIKAKTEKDMVLIEAIGKKIWNEHYINIISQEQINYMLEKFQSAKVIQEQIQNGYEYFLIKLEGNVSGYIGVSPNKDHLFLSKFYISSEYRGKGLGKKTFEFIKKLALEKNSSSIKLTVNKENTNSIEFYKKIGFKIVKPIVIDIGSGYLMDDYEMECLI